MKETKTSALPQNKPAEEPLYFAGAKLTKPNGADSAAWQNTWELNLELSSFLTICR